MPLTAVDEVNNKGNCGSKIRSLCKLVFFTNDVGFAINHWQESIKILTYSGEYTLFHFSCRIDFLFQCNRF